MLLRIPLSFMPMLCSANGFSVELTCLQEWSWNETRPEEPLVVSDSQRAALQQLAEQLQPLWEVLSQCISKVEDGLNQQSPQQEQAHLLPPEAAQVRQ